MICIGITSEITTTLATLARYQDVDWPPGFNRSNCRPTSAGPEQVNISRQNYNLTNNYRRAIVILERLRPNFRIIIKSRWSPFRIPKGHRATHAAPNINTNINKARNIPADRRRRRCLGGGAPHLRRSPVLRPERRCCDDVAASNTRLRRDAGQRRCLAPEGTETTLEDVRPVDSTRLTNTSPRSGRYDAP
ncbi:hypothetical protein GEV33_014326 [Tenebrio molitor]|uniref:Uncharacterized protein n=1 Tax=Tenebrio molitor TaxID=7067 RepID=A0A8J6L786_TENMO|nr:hypothetical protein GEV33_014326 [Tenebrio molitor]